MHSQAERRSAHARCALALLLSIAVHASLIYGTAHIVEQSARNGAQSHTPPARPLQDPAAKTKPSVQPAVQSEFEPRPAQRGTRAQSSASSGDESRLPHAAVPVLGDPVWYEAKDLDTYPRAIAVMELDNAHESNAGGTVTLLVAVDEHGVVHDAAVMDAQPAGYFEERALKIIQATQFVPAERDGRPVRSRILIKLPFTLTAEAP
jgi:protein TonB